jgi:membrane-associated phospholipid phosphatase
LAWFCLSSYFLVLVLRRAWIRLLAVSGLTLLVLAIGFSRVYLGAHYLSDVLGGYAVGGLWLTACMTAVETVRRRPRKSSTAPPHGVPRAEAKDQLGSEEHRSELTSEL